MNKIKKIIFSVILTLICIEKVNAVISDSLYMSIGNRPVTQSDIVNEIKIILILTNKSYSKEKRDQLQEAAVKSIIKRNVKEIELEQRDYYNYSKQDLFNELKRLASNTNLDLDTLKNVFASNDLDFSLVEDQVKTELHWNSLIFQLYKNRVSINPDEIDEKLKLMQNKKIEEYLISEILAKVVEKDKLENEIKDLENKIRIEGFENVARSLSISTSSTNGGDLGWLDETKISEKIKPIITATEIGNLSQPILLPEGILIFKIRDKRKVERNTSLEEAKSELINSEKTKILQMYSLSHYDKLRRSISIEFYND